MPRIMPEPRYFSIPSIVVGAAALRNEALNWTPCVRSLTQVPARLDELTGRDRRRVTKDGNQVALPRALTRSTQKPLSSLWQVTRSTRPARTSVGVLTLGAC